MRNLLCLLPDGYIQVDEWEPHPCGGYWRSGSWCWGPNGIVGYCMEEPRTNAVDACGEIAASQAAT